MPVVGVTVTLNATLVPEATLALVTEILVVVADVPPPPPYPPLQPSVKLRMQMSPSAKAARYRFLPGIRRRRIAANPVMALRPHKLLPPAVNGVSPAH